MSTLVFGDYRIEAVPVSAEKLQIYRTWLCSQSGSDWDQVASAGVVVGRTEHGDKDLA